MMTPAFKAKFAAITTFQAVGILFAMIAIIGGVGPWRFDVVDGDLGQVSTSYTGLLVSMLATAGAVATLFASQTRAKGIAGTLAFAAALLMTAHDDARQGTWNHAGGISLALFGSAAATSFAAASAIHQGVPSPWVRSLCFGLATVAFLAAPATFVFLGFPLVNIPATYFLGLVPQPFIGMPFLLPIAFSAGGFSRTAVTTGLVGTAFIVQPILAIDSLLMWFYLPGALLVLFGTLVAPRPAGGSTLPHGAN
ncbi:MAG: hypothetical protein ACYDDF_11230 [Thermoplasmatota archaeon]